MSERIQKTPINPLIGLQGYQLRRLPKEVRDIARKLYAVFCENDCELVEINPLVITDRTPVAADAKVLVDNNALYRHPDLPREDTELTPLEKEAREKNIAFIQLDGSIGVIANGAGLTMATLDALNEFDGRGGVFLDLGGTDDPAKVRKAFELMAKARPAVIFLNLFGGITKCDTVAQGIIDFMQTQSVSCPVVARIKGMNEERAREMLAGHVTPVESFEDAARTAAGLGA
jgi:succinyl-CoA synthetase beta subunit